MVNVAEKKPDQDILVPKMIPYVDKGRPSDDEIKGVRREYLHTKIDSMIEEGRRREEPVNNLHSFYIQYQIDQSGHPTLQGTREILQEIDKYGKIDPPIVWNDNYITHDRIYRGVESVYRYGCGVCNKFGQDINHIVYSNQNICDNCADAIHIGNESSDPVLEDLLSKASNKRKVMSDNDSSDDDTKKLRNDGDTSDDSTIEDEENDIGNDIYMKENDGRNEETDDTMSPIKTWVHSP